MFPLLSFRVTDAPNDAKRSFPQQERLEDGIVQQIVDEAVKRRKQSGVLIIYQNTAQPSSKPKYAILTFEELLTAQNDGNVGAEALLLTFKEKLRSIEPGNREPVNYYIRDDIGLADLLFDDKWPHGVVDEEMLLRSEEYRDSHMEDEELIGVTVVINEPRFERNREALERLLTSDNYPYDLELLPLKGAADWWESFVRSFVENYEGDDSTFAETNKPWNTWYDVTVLSLNEWIASVYKPARKILMNKFQSAKPDLPLYLGSVLRLHIDSEYQFE